MLNVKKSLEQIYSEAEEKVRKLAETYRTEVLIPACKRANMEFVAGNGNFFFDLITKKGRPQSTQIMRESDCVEQRKEYLIPIIKELNEFVFDSRIIKFGNYIKDVDRKDLK